MQIGNVWAVKSGLLIFDSCLSVSLQHLIKILLQWFYYYYHFTQGVDLVPTDVAAGLILLSQKHKQKKQQMNEVVISDRPQPR